MCVKSQPLTLLISTTYEGDYFKARFVAGNTRSEGGPKESWEAAYKVLTRVKMKTA